MTLYASPTSPFSRKVLIVARATQVPLEVVYVNVRDPLSGLRQINPLAKVPALVVNPQLTLCDSSVICEYLNEHRQGARVIPENGSQRWQQLGWEALADGILDAAVLIFMENLRPLAKQDDQWVRRQSEKVERGLNVFEDQVSQFQSDLSAPGDGRLAEIALACALEWIELRFPANTWFAQTPQLKNWAAQVYLHPWMQATRPVAT